jgi:hypothetical protein
MSNRSKSEREVQQRSKAVRHTKARLLEALAEVAAQRDGALAELANAKATIEQMKADEAAAAVRPCSPGGTPSAEALQPTEEGCMKVWFMVKGEGYRLAFAGQDANGKRWTLTKFTTGETYQQTETDAETIACSCPGGAKHGPTCNGGKGCKHARMIRAARALLCNTGPAYKPVAKRLTQAQIDEDHADQFVGVQAAA